MLLEVLVEMDHTAHSNLMWKKEVKTKRIRARRAVGAWFGSADEESEALSVQEHFEEPSNHHRWTYQAAGRANTLSSACPLPPKSRLSHWGLKFFQSESLFVSKEELKSLFGGQQQEPLGQVMEPYL